MQPYEANPDPLSSFQLPIPVPAADPDAGTLIHVDFALDWLPMVLGALEQLLLQSTWDTADPAVTLLAQERANKLIVLFQEGYIVFQPGMIINWALSSSIPTGWLQADGSAVSRTTYADLFAVIGTLYGTGDGSTTFNLPDMRGRVAVGVGQQPGGTNFADGDVGGEELVTLDVSRIPSHSHTDTGHGHAIHTFVPTAAGLEVTAASLDSGLPTSATGTASANITATGGGGAHQNMQPFIAITPIIKY